MVRFNHYKSASIVKLNFNFMNINIDKVAILDTGCHITSIPISILMDCGYTNADIGKFISNIKKAYPKLIRSNRTASGEEILSVYTTIYGTVFDIDIVNKLYINLLLVSRKANILIGWDFIMSHHYFSIKEDCCILSDFDSNRYENIVDRKTDISDIGLLAGLFEK